MKVGAGRQAGRADIADQLALMHETARCNDDSAHMAIAGAHPGRVRQPDLLAVSACPSCADHLAIGSSDDRRTIMGAEIDAAMHSGEMQNRMETDAEAGGN